MANMLFANNCNTTLNGGITAIATSMVVTSATGFPSPTGSQYFYCTLADAATQTTIEIVKVTAVSGTTFTIVRGQDGTSGTAFASGAVVSLRLVSANLNDFPKLDEANTFTFAPTFNTALAVGSGGTGLTSLTAGYIPYGNGTSAFSSSSNLYFDGTNLGIGTSSPAQRLTIQSAATTTAPQLKLQNPVVSDSSQHAADGLSAGQLLFGATGTYTLTSKIESLYSATDASFGRIASLVFSNADGTTSLSERMRIDPNGYLLVGYTTSNGAYKLQVNSQIFATNVIIATSDVKYKKNIKPVENALKTINALNPVTFDWKKHEIHNFDLENTDIGFIAQEVKSSLKNNEYVNNLVKSNECKLLDGTKEEFLGVADSKLIPILVKAIQEQQLIIEQIRQKVGL